MEKTASDNQNKKLRIAALGDIHIRPDSKYIGFENYEIINQDADIFLLAGDLTNLGTVEEAKKLSELLRKIHIPVAGVFGNHDFQSDQDNEVRAILKEEGRLIFLDETPYESEDVAFVGVKGFAGGFDNHMLTAFGEPALKAYVHEVINESLKLDTLLSLVSAEKKVVVVMHYSPIKETCVGEPEEIYSFLGSSHLVEPINNYEVDLVFHGHAHYGTHQGKTLKNIPVYNVSLEVLKKENPDSPIKIFEI
jgi:Icc-related predicted phosphoesterase